MRLNLSDISTRESAHVVLSENYKRPFWRRLGPFLGPAAIASVAYIDPGNFATNIQGGAKFGYTLLWVIVASNLMAMLIQSLSAKLGIATGNNLAELFRMQYPRWVSISAWVIMELVAIATDLAEFIGAALGFNLLFGIPLELGGILAGIVTFLILGLERHGFRPMEALITVLISVVALCYLATTIIDNPDWSSVLLGSVTPRFEGRESVLLAVGILGATVMPHAIFLHSALTQRRIEVFSDRLKKKLFRFEIIDVIISMTLAGLLNMAILIMAAATFFKNGLTDIGTIEEAHLTLQPLLGHAAGWFFGVSLLASGLSSSTVGTSSGQIIMQGFLNRHIPIWIRRLVTIVPSMIIIVIGLDPTRTLVISQVILSFGLPFAIIPLISFTSNPKLMGALVNRKHTKYISMVVAGLIVILNIYLLLEIFGGS